MNKEKEIEELEKIILQCVSIEQVQYSTIEYQEKFNGMGLRIDSAKLFSILQEAGYRKADEVREETAKEIYNSLIDETVWETDTIMISVDWLKDKIKKYGVEVDE